MMDGQSQRYSGGRAYQRLMTDRDARLILESAKQEAKSASQIILESNIAQSTAYRKLKRLSSLNLLKIEYTVGDHGRWEMRYRTNSVLLSGTTAGLP